MRNPVISPYFDEGAYKGQDVVHEGVRIPLRSLSEEKVLEKFSRRARRIINDTDEVDDRFSFRALEEGDLEALRQHWFDPEDVTFPRTLGDHLGIVAVRDGEVAAGAIWAPQGANLFLHQLVASKQAKGRHLPTILIWKSFLAYKGQYNALDIGVSYNPKRYEFFRNFAVETYPIILKKPFYTPVIRLSPFRTIRDLRFNATEAIDWKANNATFVPRGSYAITAVLEYLKKDSERREVVIVKTFGSQFITGCVTRAIEKAGYSWTLRGEITSNTRAVFALHEFGLPVFQAGDMAKIEQARAAGVPIIEDCAWREQRVWEWSDYQIFSLQKLVDLNYGGALVGVHLDDEFLWSIGCLDVVKRDRLAFEEEQDPQVAKRERLWKQYHHLVLADGMTPDDCIDYEEAIMEGWMPTVYLQRFKDDAEADAIVARLEEFGIQAGHYWGEPVVYLPIHQTMTSEEVDYMFAVVRGYFNLCRDYR